MTEIESSDYHDFVFKDGRLVGEFEQMYSKSSVAPWHQDRDGDRLDCRIALGIAEFALPGPGKVLEAGCGLGYFADLLARRLPEAQIFGCDVAPTAVHRAGAMFPDIGFSVVNLKEPLETGQTYDLVVVRGCFWYLFDAIRTVTANLAGLVAPGGRLLVAQNFPPLDGDFIGKSVLPSPDALVTLFAPSFKTLVDCRFADKTADGGNDDWVIFLGEKRSGGACDGQH